MDRARGSRFSWADTDLVDSELACGDAAAAARSGAGLVAALEGSREELGLACARLNLIAALLALGDRDAARPVCQAGWSLGEAEYDRLHAEGALLRDSDVAALAFGTA